ncbi:hypothetical protein HDU76_009164, partial [Blyttiomyces sp. JEL0837]
MFHTSSNVTDQIKQLKEFNPQALFAKTYKPSSYDSAPLNPQQQLIFEEITTSNIKLSFIEGPPGSGKTFLTKKLIAHFQSKYPYQNSVLVAGPTGASAKLFKNANTIHKAFGLFQPKHKGAKLTLGQLPLEQIDAIRLSVALFLDECSMIGDD